MKLFIRIHCHRKGLPALPEIFTSLRGTAFLEQIAHRDPVPELIRLLYNGEIHPEITCGDLSPHTLFAERFGALGKHKSTNASSGELGRGRGLSPPASQPCTHQREQIWPRR